MIRVAQESDLDGLAALDRVAFGTQVWSRESWRAEVAGDHHVHLIEDEALLVGACSVMVAGDDAELLRIAVAPDRRRSGAARRLLGHALGDAVSDGALTMFLEVREDNEAAIALYSSMGFADMARRRHYYGPAVDAVVMSRPLTRDAT